LYPDAPNATAFGDHGEKIEGAVKVPVTGRLP